MCQAELSISPLPHGPHPCGVSWGCGVAHAAEDKEAAAAAYEVEQEDWEAAAEEPATIF